jgi:hypothetical protein
MMRSSVLISPMTIVSARTIPPAANFLHPCSLISACRLLSPLRLISFRSASMSTVSTLSQPAAHNLEIAFTACSPVLSPFKLDLIFATRSQPLPVACFIMLMPCCADLPFYCQSRIQQHRLAYRYVQPRLPLMRIALLRPIFSFVIYCLTFVATRKQSHDPDTPLSMDGLSQPDYVAIAARKTYAQRSQFYIF